jgi:uncharacterized protein
VGTRALLAAGILAGLLLWQPRPFAQGPGVAGAQQASPDQSHAAAGQEAAPPPAPGPSPQQQPAVASESNQPPAQPPLHSTQRHQAVDDVLAAFQGKTLKSLQLAADQGNVLAQWKLGSMYANGDGVPKDSARAFEYFSRVVNTHSTDDPHTPQARLVASAYVALGQYYLEGIPNSPISADPGRARELFTYAASYFADADAQYDLGRLYLSGKGAPADPRLAARWFGLAANKGHYEAQAVLGAMLFKGDQVPRQAARGLMWLTLARDAASNTETWVADLYDSAVKQATENERTEALRLLEDRLKRRRE